MADSDGLCTCSSACDTGSGDDAAIVIGLLIYLYVGVWAWHHIVFTSLLKVWVRSDRRTITDRSYRTMNWSAKLCTTVFIIVAILTCLTGLVLMMLVGVYYLIIKAHRTRKSRCGSEGPGDAEADIMEGWRESKLLRYTATATAFLSTWILLDWERVLAGDCGYCREICSCCLPCRKICGGCCTFGDKVKSIRGGPRPVSIVHVSTSSMDGPQLDKQRTQHLASRDWSVPGTIATDPSECHKLAVARRYVDSLGISENYFARSHDKCFCGNCFPYPLSGVSPVMGNPPKPHSLPAGWCKFGLKAHPKTKDGFLNIDDNWHVAFHGTSSSNVVNILQTGELLMPNDVAINGQIIKPPPGHFTDNKRPTGFDIYQIFCSPTIRYAGVPAYAPCTAWHDGHTGNEQKVQVALQLRIKPGCYKVGQQTIGLPDYKIDPHFKNDELEWSTKHRGATVITDVLVKVSDP